MSMTKIAIIEDDAVINQMYRMKFEADGFDVQVADNGKSGVEMVEAFQPDIILLDLQMPEMPGDEALKKIRSKEWGKAVPVIVLTNLGIEEDRLRRGYECPQPILQSVVAQAVLIKIEDIEKGLGRQQPELS